MEHKLFKPKGFQEGKHAVVGDCNGIPMEERWEAETPAFAKEIVKNCPEGGRILDYGCGVGRLAKAVLELRPDVHVVGVDASNEMIKQAIEYVNTDGFACCRPEELSRQ
ncbi:MAG TPA: methyltransferase domain-containing protein, partial [Desulfosporosinus sp.]|nr:methyltransferase domain-containing protein [Desulfosporosinus sp.]